MADKKITALTALTTLSDDDLFVVVDDPSGTPTSKKITAANVKSGLAPLASPTFTGTVVLPSSTSVGNVSDTEIGYLDGVTSAIQTQLDAKVAKSVVTTKGDLIAATASATVARLGVGTNGQALLADSSTATGLAWGSAGSAADSDQGILAAALFL
mgnify:CR=1 FL=1